MTENKGSTVSANKVAMSRALGAAFLTHQVEQLEKSVASGGPASGNWRRQQQQQQQGSQSRPRGGRGRGRRAGEEGKDGDIIVVDGSVLVHGLYQVKKWCRSGREEVIIVPLEALNTLDLLKKGTSQLAQRARTASRVLEAQVGTNPRIRVQQDDAFVLWDNIPFTPSPTNNSPEWVRRTISCAQWQVQADVNKKVVLAVLATPADHTKSPTAPAPAVSSPPVPPPAPHVHINKHEPRCSGQLVAHWAARANIDLLAVQPSAHSDDDAKSKPRRASDPHGHPGKPHAQGALVERPPAVMAMMEVVAQPSRTVRVLARGEKLDPDP